MNDLPHLWCGLCPVLFAALKIQSTEVVSRVSMVEVNQMEWQWPPASSSVHCVEWFSQTMIRSEIGEHVIVSPQDHKLVNIIKEGMNAVLD